MGRFIRGSDRRLTNVDGDTHIYGYDAGNAQVRRIRATSEGDLHTVSHGHGEGVVTGILPGETALNKFGFNAAVGATEEIIWDFSGPFVWPSTATPCALVSGDTADAAASPGARTVQIYGLDSAYAEQNETITLNGTTATPSTNSYIRVNRMIVRTAGSNGANASTLTCYRTGSTATQAQITTDMNQTLMAMWTVPASKTFYLTRFYAGTSTAKVTQVYLRVRPEGETFQVKNTIMINAGTTDFKYEYPLSYAAKTDIYVSALAAGGGGEVSAGFDGWYE